MDNNIIVAYSASVKNGKVIYCKEVYFNRRLKDITIISYSEYIKNTV